MATGQSSSDRRTVWRCCERSAHFCVQSHRRTKYPPTTFRHSCLRLYYVSYYRIMQCFRMFSSTN